MSDLSRFRDDVARRIWHASRKDEGTISATGANIVADALLIPGGVIARIVDERVDDTWQGVRAGVIERARAEGAAAVRARVGALADEWERMPEPPDEDYEGTTEGHYAFGEWLATRRAAQRLRAALAGTEERT